MDDAAFARIHDGFDQFAHAFIELMQPVVKAISTFAEQLRSIYDRAGQPYGPTDDDMMRWFQDQGREQRALLDAEDEQAWEEGLVALRERLARRANRRRSG